MTTDEILRQAATNIIKNSRSPPSKTTPSLHTVDKTRNGLLLLAKLLNRAEKIPDLSEARVPVPVQRVKK